MDKTDLWRHRKEGSKEGAYCEDAIATMEQSSRERHLAGRIYLRGREDAEK
jgi:hypothetical protein